MKSYKKIFLSVKAKNFIKARFNEAGHFLSKEFSKKARFKGAVYTFFGINQRFKKAQLEEFDWCWILPEPVHDDSEGTIIPVPNTDKFLVDVILDILKEVDNAICVFEEPLMGKNDSCFPKRFFYNLPVWLGHGKDIYYFLYGDYLNKDIITEIIRWAGTAYPGLICFIASMPKGLTLNFKNRKITDAQMFLLAKNIQYAILGVYDGESYLVWSKK